MYYMLNMPVYINIKQLVSFQKLAMSFIYTIFQMEKWPSGLRRMPGKRVYVKRIRGSNPLFSAIYHSL